MPPALYSRNSTFIEELSIKNSFGKTFTRTYLNLPINLRNLSTLPNIQCKSDLLSRPRDLNNVQVTDIKDVHKH